MAKYAGYDVALKVKSGGSYVTIAQVRDISGPALKQDAVEVTHRDGSKWREFVGGLRDGGEVTFDVVYDPDQTTQAAGSAPGLAYMLANGTLGDFQLAFPDTTPTTCQFYALVTAFSPKAPMADALTADATLKLSGAPTWA